MCIRDSPINVRAGKGMALTGTANAALGTTLTNVQVAVLDENDQTVFTLSLIHI